MKNISISFILIVLLFFLSCKDDDIDALNIEGKWELESSFGGWSGLRTYPSGNGSILKFERSTYHNYEQEKLIKNGNYKILREFSELTKTEENKIIFDENTNVTGTLVDLKDGKLFFIMEANDGVTTTYIKL